MRQARPITAGAYRARVATPTDLEGIVQLDLRTFRHVYRHRLESAAAIEREVRDLYSWRLAQLTDWVAVLDGPSGIEGVVVCCPTSAQPADFSSWEEMTDRGKLATLFNPHGNNLYLVTLSLSAAAARLGLDSVLTVRMIAPMIERNIELAFFEARLPGLRRWATSETRRNGGSAVDNLTTIELHHYATRYVAQRVTVNGKSVRLDPELRMYEALGNKLEKVIVGAYEDPASLNCGALMVYRNPLPPLLRSGPVGPIARPATGRLCLLATRFPRATARAMSRLS